MGSPSVIVLPMDLIYGIIGFVGFEALRVYKRLNSGQPAVPQQTGLYVLVILILAVFAGFIAHVFGHGNVMQSLVLGFSVPSGVKTILEPSEKRQKSPNDTIEYNDTVDDIDSRPPTRPDGPLKVIRSFFHS